MNTNQEQDKRSDGDARCGRGKKMRLIDGDALKEKIEKYRIVHLSHRRLSAIKREAEEVINDICFAIDVAQAIDPVKHGRWIKNERKSKFHIEPVYLCSCCREQEAWGQWELSNYCPNCGAKMDEVER